MSVMSDAKSGGLCLSVFLQVGLPDTIKKEDSHAPSNGTSGVVNKKLIDTSCAHSILRV